MIRTDSIHPTGDDDTLPVLRPGREPRGAVRPLSSFDVAGRTDQGHQRARNEDQFVVADLERLVTIRQSSVSKHGDPPWAVGGQGLLLAVADGMGGHPGGDVASSVAIDALVQYATWLMPWISGSDDRSRAVLDDFGTALRLCERRVRRVSRREGQLKEHEPGTTLTAAYIAWPSMFVIHAGDTRCYLLRQGIIAQLTIDHTLANQLVERDVMPPEAVEQSQWSHVLCNAVGGNEQDVKPEVKRVELRRGDEILVCSDGLTRHVDDATIARIVADADHATVACDALVAAANDAGGRDNITVVVAREAGE
jgi:protein phosphatase